MSEFRSGAEAGIALANIVQDTTTTQRKFTGKLRWYGNTLQQELESITWRNGHWQDHALEWIDVPQVPVEVVPASPPDELTASFNPAKGSPATAAQMSLLFTQKVTKEHQHEAVDWLHGEHQEVMGALDAHNTGEDDG